MWVGLLGQGYVTLSQWMRAVGWGHLKHATALQLSSALGIATARYASAREAPPPPACVGYRLLAFLR